MDRDVAQAALRMQPEEHELKQLRVLAVADDEPTLIFLARTLTGEQGSVPFLALTTEPTEDWNPPARPRLTRSRRQLASHA